MIFLVERIAIHKIDRMVYLIPIDGATSWYLVWLHATVKLCGNR